MSQHKLTIVLDIDDDALEEHVGEGDGTVPPYSTDVGEWDATDIFDAYDNSIINSSDCYLTGDHEVLPGGEGDAT